MTTSELEDYFGDTGPWNEVGFDPHESISSVIDDVESGESDARIVNTLKKVRNELFWLTDTMDDDQQNGTDELKERAVHPSIADFVQRLAEWGFNNCDNGYVWEAMCAVIEAGERGDLDDLIGCYDDDEADEYFKHKEAIE